MPLQKHAARAIAATGLSTLVCAMSPAPGRIRDHGSSPPAEVTIQGVVLNNVHTGGTDKSVFVYALDGTPEVRAGVNRIVSETHPERGLDADRARAVLDLWTANLKYLIDGPLADELHKQATYGARQVMAVTGTVEERLGKKWISVSKCEPTAYTWPAWMLAPDRPAATPRRDPLLLRIDDRLTLKCVWVPPGKFLMGEPYYQCPHWQESPPHLVTLTRGLYMSEHPITQGMFEALVGANRSRARLPEAPVNSSCTDMYAFCRLLSERTGRHVRVPTAAEWEYAARVGTSNPTFKEKYQAQDNSASRPWVVKSKPPNAWGLYDMVGSGWERVSDSSDTIDRKDAVDPEHVPREDRQEADRGRKHGHVGKGNGAYSIDEFEYITNERGPETTYPGVIRFRVVVEAGAVR